MENVDDVGVPVGDPFALKAYCCDCPGLPVMELYVSIVGLARAAGSLPTGARGCGLRLASSG